MTIKEALEKVAEFQKGGQQVVNDRPTILSYSEVDFREGKATESERHLLSAETIIADVMGTDNDYMKTVYRYLHSLYTRWRKPELAQKYKEKYLEANKNKLKIAP